jgi:serine/threonine-protein kinase
LVADLREQLHSGLADRYRLDRELGRGGMATVFLAHDLRHERPVALKVLHPELAATLGPERFQREIKLAARLQHPHILSVHDSGETAGQLWFTMPYVDGESLRDRLRREAQLPVEDAVRIATESARALEYAHQQGIVHRDIKPENLLLTRDGTTLVADFGIARALGTSDDQLTRTGMSVGTPAYMSPEQAAGDRNLDGRTDVYSLGTVLYEMLAGEPPYTGPSAQAIIVKRLLDPVPSVRRLRPNVPEGVDRTVICSLAIAPADRFGSAAEFARALQPGAATPPIGRTVAVTVPGPTLSRGRRAPAAAITLGLGILIGLGALFAWRRSHSGEPRADRAKVLAVLPFENLGDSADGYFAEGVANDLRAKLSQVAGLSIIGRGSSNEYKGTTKTQQEIAQELEADYLLTATVQWEKGAAGTSRVRVTPELVDVREGRAPRTRWGQQYDAALTSVFDVQAEIAGQVVQAMNVALGDSTQRGLAAKPTENLPAYDAFLRGEAAFNGGATGPQNARQAVAAYEQAVALDSSFVAAWSRLAQAQALRYFQGPHAETVAEAARRAAERAQSLAPNRYEGHQALAFYYGMVLGDYSRALTEDSTAFALSPGNAELLGYVGWDNITLGRWEEARKVLEQAVRLDPRVGLTSGGLRLTLIYTRRYREAKQAIDRALKLRPANLTTRQDKVWVALAQGDLLAAQAVMKAIPKEVDPATIVAFMGSESLGWVLDEGQQQLLMRLRPSAFDDDRAAWGMALAQSYALRGHVAKAAIYADSARKAYETQINENSQGGLQAMRHVFLGLALAYLGRKAEAIRTGQRAVALMPTTKDAQWGPYIQHQLVRIYILVGEPEKALDQLEPLLRTPYLLSPGWLKIDPNFDPLRGNPRFERLVRGG